MRASDYKWDDMCLRCGNLKKFCRCLDMSNDDLDTREHEYKKTEDLNE